MAHTYLGPTFRRGREASLRNRPVTLSSLLVAAVCLVAAPVVAQQARPATGPTPGMRYLSWAGKGEAPARPQATPVATAGDGLRRPMPVTDRRTAGAAATSAVPSPTTGRSTRYGSTAAGGLTPASAWMPSPAPRPTPSIAAQTTAAPDISPPLPSRPIAEAVPTSAVRAAVVVSSPQPAASETQPATSEFDPMAPRRDALIYRMQGAQPADHQAPQAPPTSLAEPTPVPSPYALADQSRGGARYYSVHRAAGHQPDRAVIPEAVYLDSAPIDLAEPPATPVPARTVNGRAQIIVPNEDPSLP